MTNDIGNLGSPDGLLPRGPSRGETRGANDAGTSDAPASPICYQLKPATPNGLPSPGDYHVTALCLRDGMPPVELAPGFAPFEAGTKSDGSFALAEMILEAHTDGAIGFTTAWEFRAQFLLRPRMCGGDRIFASEISDWLASRSEA